MSVIFHIDVNSAFLSWTAVEQLKNGATIDIREIPAIIGGDEEHRHGIVAAKSIPAKKYGIHTGEPVVDAFRKCPILQAYPGDFALYRTCSRRLMDFLRSYTSEIEQVSIDECYFNYSSIAGLYPDPVAFAHEIKDQVHKRFGFTVNVGISDVKVLAKMASDFEKPDKVHTLYRSEIREKMWPLPVSDLFMAGKSTVEKLKLLEIRTIGDLANTDPKILELHLKSHGRTLWNFANGLDEGQVTTVKEKAKGIGHSTTLTTDLKTKEECLKVLAEVAEEVSGRMRKKQMKAALITVEIKYFDFTSVSHQRQLKFPVNSERNIYKEAKELFLETWSGKPVRLLGIRGSKLVDEGEPEQMTLFDWMDAGEDEVVKEEKKSKKHEQIDSALQGLRQKYGNDIIRRGKK